MSTVLERLVLLTTVALLCSSCRVLLEPQPPVGDGPFDVRRLSQTYALTVDESGRPFAVWDLGYPVVRREGDEEREHFPVRLVNFLDPSEREDRRRAEKRTFGFRSFFWGLVTLNVAKWHQTTDLFDVREVRAARRAMLGEWLRSTGPDDLEREGLVPDDVAEALEQLASPPRDSADLVGWTVLHIGERPVALLDVASGDRLPLDGEVRGEGVSDHLSLAANTTGTALLTGGSIALGLPVGIPVNVVTSVVPLAPFRKQSPYFEDRGRLLTRLALLDRALPPDLEPHRDALLRAVRDALLRDNAYWPVEPGVFDEAGWTWLLRESRARRRSDPVPAGSAQP